MKFAPLSGSHYGLVHTLLILTCIIRVSTTSIGLRVHKPTIVIVPGAWHSPIHYTELAARLRRGGFPVVSLRNPSVNSNNPNAQSAAGDAASIRNNLLLPQIDAGNDVILAMHSYGGCPGATAAKGLSKQEMAAQGRKGGIIGLIFICALLTKDGESLLSKLPGQVFDPWVIQYETGQLGVRDPKQVFYADVPSPFDQFAIAEIRPQSRAALSTPGGPPAWADTYYDGRRSYFQTLNDNSIPSIAQQAFLDSTGVDWSVKRFASSHSPFLSHPDVLSTWMMHEAARFARTKKATATS